MVFWKDWPRWIRWGIIAGVFILIIQIIVKLIGESMIAYVVIWVLPNIVPFLIYDFIFFPIFGEEDPNYLFPIFSICFYFLFGALLGLITWKIKPYWNNWTNKSKSLFLSIIITVIHFLLVLSADYIFHPTDFATIIFAPLLIIGYYISDSYLLYLVLLFLSELIVFILAFIIIFFILKIKNKNN